jgi:hypothetical protein
MTIAPDRVIALAPAQLLKHPPADLHVVLHDEGGQPGGVPLAVARIDVAGGQPPDAPLWSAIVSLQVSLGLPEDFDLALSPEAVRRGALAHPSDPWAALEAAGAFMSGRRSVTSLDVPTSAEYTGAQVEAADAVVGDHDEDLKSFFCRVCPWWCDEPEPEPDPE